MSGRPELQGRRYDRLAPWVLVCVTLAAVSLGCLRRASQKCDREASDDQCFQGEVCWRGTCTPSEEVPEADGGPTDTDTDTGSGEPDTRSADADGGEKNDMSLEVVTDFDEPIDKVTEVEVEVEPPSGDSVARVTWTDGYDGGKTFEMSRAGGNTWSVTWEPAGGDNQSVVAAAESVGGATATVSFKLEVKCPGKRLYRDVDGDGYGVDEKGGNNIPVCGKVYERNGERFVPKKGDCNDAYASVKPGATERCDGFDTDCQDDGEPDYCSQTSGLPDDTLQVNDVEVYDDEESCRVAVVGSAEVPGSMGSDIQGWVRVYDCSQFDGLSSNDMPLFGATKVFGGVGKDRPIAVSWEDASKLHVIGNVGGGGALAPFVRSYQVSEMEGLVETISEQLHNGQQMNYLDGTCESEQCLVVGFKSVQGGKELFVDRLAIDHALGDSLAGNGTVTSDLHLFEADGEQVPTAIVADPVQKDRYWVGGYTKNNKNEKPFWGVKTEAGGSSGFVAPLKINKQEQDIDAPAETEVIGRDSPGYARVEDLAAVEVGGSPRLYYTGTDGSSSGEGEQVDWGKGNVFVAGFEPGSGGVRPSMRCTFGSMAEQGGPRMTVDAEGRVVVVGQTEGAFEGKPLRKGQRIGGIVRAPEDISACPTGSPGGSSLVFGTLEQTSPKAVQWVPGTDFVVTGGIQSMNEDPRGFLRLFEFLPTGPTP